MSKQDFLAGFAAAVASLVRDFGDNEEIDEMAYLLANHLLADSGLTLEDFENCDAENQDIGIIKSMIQHQKTKRVSPDHNHTGKGSDVRLEQAFTGASVITTHLDVGYKKMQQFLEDNKAPTTKLMTSIHSCIAKAE